MVLQSVLRVSSSQMRTSVGDGSVVPACVISTRVNVTSMCLLSVNASFVIKSHCLPKTLLCVKRSRLIPFVRAVVPW